MRKIAIVVGIVSALSALPHLAVAQTIRVPNVTATEGLTNPEGGLFPSKTNPAINFPNLITSFTSGDFLNDSFQFVVNILTLFGGIIAFGYMIYGGAKFITSGGNPAAAEEGKKIVIGSIIGVVIVALSFILVMFVRSVITG